MTTNLVSQSAVIVDTRFPWQLGQSKLNRPNEKWGVDISSIWIREGWLYLAVVIDLFSRRVAGWAVGDRLHRRLGLAALSKAIPMRRPPEGLIHRSDRHSLGGFNRSSQAPAKLQNGDLDEPQR